jgi:hypothetical protein
VTTALADGADRLVADGAENLIAADGTEASLMVIAVSPMEFATYRVMVAGQARLAHHRDRAGTADTAYPVCLWPTRRL